MAVDRAMRDANKLAVFYPTVAGSASARRSVMHTLAPCDFAVIRRRRLGRPLPRL